MAVGCLGPDDRPCLGGGVREQGVVGVDRDGMPDTFEQGNVCGGV